VENLAADVDTFTSNVFLIPGDPPALVDTGANFDLVTRLRDRVGALGTVVLTHTHDDHVGNVDAVREGFGVETVGWDADRPAVDRAVDDGRRSGWAARPTRSCSRRGTPPTTYACTTPTLASCSPAISSSGTGASVGRTCRGAIPPRSSTASTGFGSGAPAASARCTPVTAPR
jgi:hypothetical protein